MNGDGFFCVYVYRYSTATLQNPQQQNYQQQLHNTQQKDRYRLSQKNTGSVIQGKITIVSFITLATSRVIHYFTNLISTIPS
jgi:hypothetical protein